MIKNNITITNYSVVNDIQEYTSTIMLIDYKHCDKILSALSDKFADENTRIFGLNRNRNEN